jgi:arylsulfatase A-like enzyme
MAQELNLVLVTVDSLRHDALGCLHNSGGPSPNLDRLAEKGVLFTGAVSNGPRTPSAFPAILCSLHPLVSGETGLPPGATTLAETLSAAGRRTAGFNLDNPYLSEQCGYARGFDRYDDFWQAKVSGREGVRRSPVKRLKKAVQDAIGRRSLALLLFFQTALQRGGAPFLMGEAATGRALDWIDEEKERPFFAWLHYMDVHYPYLPLEKPGSGRRLTYLGALGGLLLGARRRPLRLMRELYQARVERMDRMIGRLVAGLEERGLMERTLVAITADHGEMFGEHGSFTHGPKLYDELLRVPLILLGGVMGQTVEEQVGLIDLSPTLLDLLGVEAPAVFQGRSFRGLLDGEQWSGDPVISAATHAGGRKRRGTAPEVYRILSCRDQGWKYIFDEEGGTEELYDLVNDPGERVNIIAQRPERAEPLRRRVLDHLEMAKTEAARLGQGDAGNAFHEDEEVSRRLADLGYL